MNSATVVEHESEADLHLLVIDDDERDAGLIREGAEEASQAVHVQWARSAEDAMNQLDAGYRPSLILLDQYLPGADGLSFLRRIKSMQALRAVPVFVLSGADDPNIVEDAYAAGAAGYLSKPMVFRELTRAIADLLRFWTHTQQPGSNGDDP